MRPVTRPVMTFSILVGVTACAGDDTADDADTAIAPLLAQYATVRLAADQSSLSDAERRMLPLLIEAARRMDPLFWDQAYGDADSLLDGLRDGYRRYATYNYGPWDRLAGDSAFVPGVGPKPLGGNLYPADMTREEFEAYVAAHPEQADAMRSLYTLVQRAADGTLRAVPYHVAYRAHLDAAARTLRDAAALAEDPALARYLELRAEALVTDEYQPSDMAWLDMKDNTLDVVIGAIETYEDRLFGYKAAYEGYVLIRDRAWSERLSRYAALLPGLQRGLPVPAAYKREMPGTGSDLNAYDAVYYAGQANAGSKTIAINLPNDPEVQRAKGTRRLQLKNAMRAKFDSILVPIADLLIVEDQRAHVTFDAFFANTMFHEIAHGLGITTTTGGAQTVREALREHASALEEGKADILGLWMITSLFDDGEIAEGDVRDNYVTFLASVFRSVRFGASSAHGKANMVRFNFFEDRGAFTRDAATGTYRVNFDAMRDATRELSERILRLQGDGDYDGAGRLLADRGVIGHTLRADLARLAQARIPVDIVFQQAID